MLAVVLVVGLLGYKVYRGVADWKEDKPAKRYRHPRPVVMQNNDGGFFAEAKDNLGLMAQGRFLEKAPSRAKRKNSGIITQSAYSSESRNYYKDRRR